MFAVHIFNISFLPKNIGFCEFWKASASSIAFKDLCDTNISIETHLESAVLLGEADRPIYSTAGTLGFIRLKYCTKKVIDKWFDHEPQRPLFPSGRGPFVVCYSPSLY